MTLHFFSEETCVLPSWGHYSTYKVRFIYGKHIKERVDIRRAGSWVT